MVDVSILDVCPIPEGGTSSESLRRIAVMARTAEAAGYRRYWFAEHHAMPGVASSAPAVLVGHAAEQTSTIRIGAGGVMLPNHAPLVVAEQFGTLEALYPGRIDLGLGRATGGDPAIARALRRDPAREAAFAEEVRELISLVRPAEGRAGIVAVPGAGSRLPLWILGSSLAGAEVAAFFGLPFAFAAHFAPAQIDTALALYRERFRPSAQADAPRVMIAVNVCAAETDAEAARLHTSLQLAFAQMAQGKSGRLPHPVKAVEDVLPLPLLTMVDARLRYSAVGAAERVARALGIIVARHAPDELILSHTIHDEAARRRSIEIAGTACRALAPPTWGG